MGKALNVIGGVGAALSVLAATKASAVRPGGSGTADVQPCVDFLKSPYSAGQMMSMGLSAAFDGKIQKRDSNNALERCPQAVIGMEPNPNVDALAVGVYTVRGELIARVPFVIDQNNGAALKSAMDAIMPEVFEWAGGIQRTNVDAFRIQTPSFFPFGGDELHHIGQTEYGFGSTGAGAFFISQAISAAARRVGEEENELMDAAAVQPNWVNIPLRVFISDHAAWDSCADEGRESIFVPEGEPFFTFTDDRGEKHPIFVDADDVKRRVRVIDSERKNENEPLNLSQSLAVFRHLFLRDFIYRPSGAIGVNGLRCTPLTDVVENVSVGESRGNGQVFVVAGGDAVRESIEAVIMGIRDQYAPNRSCHGLACENGKMIFTPRFENADDRTITVEVDPGAQDSARDLALQGVVQGLATMAWQSNPGPGFPLAGEELRVDLDEDLKVKKDGSVRVDGELDVGTMTTACGSFSVQLSVGESMRTDYASIDVSSAFAQAVPAAYGCVLMDNPWAASTALIQDPTRKATVERTAATFVGNAVTQFSTTLSVDPTDGSEEQEDAAKFRWLAVESAKAE